MFHATGEYFRTLSATFGRGWNRFWYAPRDPYSLCVIRCLTGLFVLYLHATLAPDLVRFFGPNGLLPVEVVREVGQPIGTAGGPHGFSYLDYLSTPSALGTAHLVGFIVLVLFTIGWQTRLNSVLALIVVLSDVNRAPMITSPAEPIATLLMCYLCLGPAGAYLSVDHWLRRRKPTADDLRRGLAPGQVPPSSAATVSIRLMQVHLALLYGLMGTSQLMGDAWWSGMGIWWLIARPESRLVDLTWLHNVPYAEHPYLIELWSHATVAFELAFAVLIWNRLARPLLLGLSVVLWAGLAMVTGQVPWAAIMLVGNLAYVPSEFLRALFSRGGQRPVASAMGRTT